MVADMPCSRVYMLLVHNERFEVLVVEPVELGNHVTVAEMGVLIYPHDEEPGKCVDDQITQFKPGTMKLPLNLVIVFMVSFQLVVAGYFVEVIRRLSTEPVGIRALTSTRDSSFSSLAATIPSGVAPKCG